MPRPIPLALLLLLAAAPTLHAQHEAAAAALARALEGSRVAPKLDVPGTAKGIDVHVGADRPVDFARYGDRLKEFGVAIRAGEPVVVTKVKVKKDLIEFQLAGGGFGTFGDDASTDVTVLPEPKGRREKWLEDAIKRETRPERKRAYRDELDELRRERERADRQNAAASAAAGEQKRAYVREQRRTGGGRFNLRYKGGVPAEAVTPEAVRAALAEYVDFAPAAQPAGAGAE